MILARFRPAEGTVWYLADKLDTVRDVANAFGTPIAHVDLDTFGGVAALADPELVGRYLFTGREFDSETSPVLLPSAILRSFARPLSE